VLVLDDLLTCRTGNDRADQLERGFLIEVEEPTGDDQGTRNAGSAVACRGRVPGVRLVAGHLSTRRARPGISRAVPHPMSRSRALAGTANLVATQRTKASF
jgi:hypothetical protein